MRALRLDRLALGTVGATLALMTLGSIVHGTGSSLACPDWPLCHGSALPPMTGGIRFEHSHRLAALGVVTLTVALTLGVWRRSGSVERRLAVAACGLVALQAALGALTVLWRLPPAVSVAHLATSMAFLSVLVTLMARLTGLAPARSHAPSRVLFTMAAGVAYLQIVLGGAVRHTGAALACPDWPLCMGSAWPDASLQRLQMMHRGAAILVLLAVLASTVVAWRARSLVPRRVLVAAPAVLVVGQIVLGLAIVSSGAPLPLVTAHHANGAVLLASLMLARSSC